MANEHLLAVETTNQEFAIEIPAAVLNCDGAMSGLVPDGDYRLKCIGSSWTPKKGGGGINLAMQFTVDAPERINDETTKGVRIAAWLRAPIGDPTSEEYQKALRQVGRLANSFLSCEGTAEDTKAKGKFKFSPKGVIGKCCFAHLVSETDDRGQLRSRIAFYITATDFAASQEQASSFPTPSSSVSQEVQPQNAAAKIVDLIG